MSIDLASKSHEAMPVTPEPFSHPLNLSHTHTDLKNMVVDHVVPSNPNQSSIRSCSIQSVNDYYHNEDALLDLDETNIIALMHVLASDHPFFHIRFFIDDSCDDYQSVITNIAAKFTEKFGQPSSDLLQFERRFAVAQRFLTAGRAP